MMPDMSIADESQVSHRPPQVGDRVEVRIAGKVDSVEDGRVLVELDPNETGTCMPIWRPADQVAVLRDVPRDQSRAFRAHHGGLEPRLPTE